MKKVLMLISALILLGGVAEAKKKEMGIQLYSVRNEINKDGLDNVLKAVAKAGYTYVEAASYDDRNGNIYGVSPETFKAKLAAVGLRAVSCHITHGLSEQEIASGDFSQALKWWDKAIDAHKRAGMTYIVTPWMNVPKTLKELSVWCRYYNAIGAKCKAAGVKYGYHNHSHEFVQVEGKCMYDYMIENTDADKVFFEMDVYWACMGKAYPVEYFKKYPGRFALLHIKDHFEIGASGMVGFDAIFQAAQTAGLEGYICEMEGSTYGDMYRTINESSAYLLNAPFVKKTYKK